MKVRAFVMVIALTFLLSPAVVASEFEVVAALGVTVPAGLEAGQPLAASTVLKLEPWGRAVIRETSGCQLTHIIAGAEQHQLEVSEDCSHNEEPLGLAALIQQGQRFSDRIKEAKAGPAADLVTALSLNPCVFLATLSEEGANRRNCPTGYALRAMRCSGSWCDNKDLMCCPYLEGAPDTSHKEVQARQISEEFPNVSTTRKFMFGMTCWGPYCDNVQPHAFKSERLKNTRKCDWTPWVSELPPTWVDCGEGRLVAGLRCRHEYCGDLALQCCEYEAK